MPKIKSFIYLDEYKMYSISSQIFEGITEYLKEAVMNLVEGLSEVESEFSGKLANEIIVDPIAIYREI